MNAAVYNRHLEEHWRKISKYLQASDAGDSLCKPVTASCVFMSCQAKSRYG